MLIRQKAGWRLHHQAYLWPRRSRSPPLSPLSTSLPRRRGSGNSSGGSAANSGDDSASSRTSQRISSSSSNSSFEDTPQLPSSSPQCSRSKKNGNRSRSRSSPSATSGSTRPPPSRKRKASNTAEQVKEAETTLRGVSSGGNSRPWDPDCHESTVGVLHKRRRRSSDSTSSEDSHLARDSKMETDNTSSKDSDTDCNIQTDDSDQVDTQASCNKREEYTISDPNMARHPQMVGFQGLEPSITVNSINCYSGLKGSNISNASSKSSENNNYITQCTSHHESSSSDNEYTIGNGCIDSINDTCSWITKMGFYRERNDTKLKKHSSTNRTTGSHNHHDSLRRKMSDFSVHISNDFSTALIHTRVERPSSPSSHHAITGATTPRRKLQIDILPTANESGPRRDGLETGAKKQTGCQCCCSDVYTASPCDVCTSHLNTPTISSPESQSESSLSSSSSITEHSIWGIDNNHSQQDHLTPADPALPEQSQGSTVELLTAETSDRQLPLSHLHSPASFSRQKQFTQESTSSHGGSNSSSDGNNDDDDNTISSSSSDFIPESPNSTVLDLACNLTPIKSTRTSYSQPPSPQSSTPSSTKSEPFLVTSASSPTLSSLVNQSPTSVQPSVVQCKWRGCSSELDASDLLEHIRKHVEAQIEKKTYACFWTDCKVFNKPSWSCSWLERHIVSHSGHRPFKCILDNCGQRFHSQAVLERHVNSHFAANNQTGTKTAKTREDIPPRAAIQKRRKLMKRRVAQAVKMNDFFDDQTMAVVKHELQSMVDYTKLDVSGIALHITFHGLVCIIFYISF